MHRSVMIDGGGDDDGGDDADADDAKVHTRVACACVRARVCVSARKRVRACAYQWLGQGRYLSTVVL